MSTSLPKTLPAAIERKLAAVRRRIVLIAAARGLAIGGAVLLVTMIAAMSIDWLATLFDPVIRTTLTISTLTTAGVTLVIVAAGPIRRAMQRSHAACVVDAAVPQLQQRWTTIASFEGSNTPTSPLTRSMLEQVASEAVAMQSLVHPNRIVSAVALRSAALALAGSALAMAAFLAVHWEQTSILLQRFLSPMQSITATELTSITGNLLIPRGEMIELLTIQSGLRRSAAELIVEFPSGASEVFRIPAQDDEPNTFARVIRADESLHYRFRAGDGQTQWHALQVIDYPEIAEVQFTLTAPEYVNRPVVTKDLIPRQVKVIQGTHLALFIKPKDPVERFVIALATPDPEAPKHDATVREVELIADADGWYRFQSHLLDDVTLRPTLFSTHGLSDKGRSFCKVQVVADQAPVARVVRPTDELAVAPDDVLQIEFEAHDDHGISTAELVIYDDSVTEEGQPKVLATRLIPLGEQSLQKHVTGSIQLDLKDLGLDSGRSISYAVRVTDNREVTFSPLELSSPALHAPSSQNDPLPEAWISSDRSLDAAAQAAGDPPVARAPELEPSQREKESEQSVASAAPKNLVAAEGSAVIDGSAVEPLKDTAPTADPLEVASQSASPAPTIIDRLANNSGQPDAATLPPQQSQSGQNVESNRRRLKITGRLAPTKFADRSVSQTDRFRGRVAAIDTMLEETETALKTLVDHQVSDARRGEEFANLDARFGGIEQYAADLRAETKDNEYAFVGLQMIDIIRTHVTPARDRVFAAIRNPNASDVDAKVALGHVLRSRELLAALLARFDQVRRDRELSRALEESMTMYDVYVEKRLALMREARENRNPLRARWL